MYKRKLLKKPHRPSKSKKISLAMENGCILLFLIWCIVYYISIKILKCNNHHFCHEDDYFSCFLYLKKKCIVQIVQTKILFNKAVEKRSLSRY